MDFLRRIASFRISHPTISGLWYAFLWMMIGALLLSILLQAGTLEEYKLNGYTYVVHGVALLFGGIVSGKRAGQKGWYQGTLTGLIYTILILLVSFLAMDTSLGLNDLSLLIPACGIGALGGIFGVNLHRSK